MRPGFYVSNYIYSIISSILVSGLVFHSILFIILKAYFCSSSICFQLTSIFSYSMIMVLVISSIVIGITDPDYDRDAYFWMCLHILSTGDYSFFFSFGF